MHTKKPFALFLVLYFAFILNSFCQQESKDVLYLKNGSVIKGQILEMIPGGTIKIETADGSIFVFKMDEVEKTTKEIAEKKTSPKVSRPEPEPTSGNVFKPKGWFGIVKIGPYGNLLTDDELDISIGGIFGYQMNEFVSVGLGIEANNWSGDEYRSTIVPIYVDARLFIPKHRVHPMFHIQLGAITGDRAEKDFSNSFGSYDFIPNPVKGGIFVGFGAGFKMFASKKIAFITNGGLAFHSLKGWRETNVYNPDTNSYENEFKDARETLASFKMDMGVVLYFNKQ
jgi:hypothetical protein